MSELKGENVLLGREVELDKIKSSWCKVKQGIPQICVLRSESGYGKTKIAQAFYSKLSSDAVEDPNGYWPDSLVQEGSNLVVNPIDGFGENIPIPWLWWGTRWSEPSERNRQESSKSGLLSSLNALEPHRCQLEQRREAYSRWLKLAGTIADFVPVLGDILTIKDLVEQHQDEKEAQRRRGLTVEELQDEAIHLQLNNVTNFFKQILSSETPLPVILLLDDSQWIDTYSCRFIKKLFSISVENSWPLMILATHWEREWYQLENKEETIPSIIKYFRSDLINIIDIGPLKEVVKLLELAFPGITQEQKSEIENRVNGNPRLMQEIILELKEDYDIYFEDEDCNKPLKIGAIEKLQELSFNLDDIQKRRFQKLSTALKKQLSYASIQGGSVLKKLAYEINIALEQGNDVIGEAVSPYAILAEINSDLYEFRSNIFYELSRKRIEDEADLKRVLLTIGYKWVEQGDVDHLSERDREIFYHLILENYQEELSPDKGFQLQLISKLISFYSDTGYYRNVEIWLEKLTELWPEESETSFTLISYYDQARLVGLYSTLNQWERAERLAAKLLEHVLFDLESHGETAKRLGEVAASQVRMGDILQAQDKPHDALALYKSASVINQRIVETFGETVEHLGEIAASQLRVGDILHAQDKPDDALVLYRSALAINERIVEEYDETSERLGAIAASQLRLGDVLQAQDKLHDALVLYRNALAVNERIVEVYGDTSKRLKAVAISQSYVGNALQAQDKLDDALVLYRSALAINERIVEVYGDTSARLGDLVASQLRVGDNLQVQGKPDDALVLYRSALAANERIVEVYGETSARLEAFTTSQLLVGNVLLEQEKLDDALVLYRSALAINERIVEVYGETSTRLRAVAILQSRTGNALQAQDKPDDALVFYRSALAINERIVELYGETSARLRAVAISQSHVGNILQSQGNLDDALVIQQKALATTERIVEVYGETSDRLRSVIVTQSRVASLLGQVKPDDALVLYRSALETNKRIVELYGETSENLLNLAIAQSSVGALLISLGKKPEEALGLSQASLNLHKKVMSEFGETSIRLSAFADSQARLASLLLAQGNKSESLSANQSCLSTRKYIVEKYGENNERLVGIRDSLFMIADMSFSQGMLNDSLILWEDIRIQTERIISQSEDRATELLNLSVVHIRLADTFLSQRKIDNALPLYQSGLEIIERVITEYGYSEQRKLCIDSAEERLADAIKYKDNPKLLMIHFILHSMSQGIRTIRSAFNQLLSLVGK